MHGCTAQKSACGPAQVSGIKRISRISQRTHLCVHSVVLILQMGLTVAVARNSEDDFTGSSFDKDQASGEAGEMSRRVLNDDIAVAAAAQAECVEAGISLVGLLSDAHNGHKPELRFHEDKLIDLENRRRRLMADYRAMQDNRAMSARVVSK